MTADMIRDRHAAEIAAERAVRMNVLAAKHFNAGLRAIFLSIGYLGWFISPYAFVGLTIFVIFVLTRRQFFSEARAACWKTPPANCSRHASRISQDGIQPYIPFPSNQSRSGASLTCQSHWRQQDGEHHVR